MASYPLHRLVFNGDEATLQRQLSSAQFDLDEKDNRGNTPLQLALQLGNSKCASILLQFGADPLVQDPAGWAPLHHATCLKDRELMATILNKRAALTRAELQDKIPELLTLLESSGDFYVEMNWEFSSWIPLVSRLCPSDTYRIWKRGNSVRVDTTLVGYNNLRWQRGQRSFVFRAAPSGESVRFEMTQLDHDKKVSFTEEVTAGVAEVGPVSSEELDDRINSAVTTTQLDSENIEFSRVKSGIWGWQSDKVEDVSGYSTKVYNASGIEAITKTRFDHLPQGHPARKKSKNPLSQLMSMAGGASAETAPEEESLLEHNDERDETDPAIEGSRLNSAEAYFTEGADAPVTVGRPREIRTQTQKFKAKLWMGDEFPLSLHNQVLPIIDLMAPTSPHLAKLRDFISLQLPSGFPVKVEIPVYHVLSAKVTFSAFEAGCEDATVFEIPEHYRQMHSSADIGAMDEEDVMLARALQMSLRDHDGYGGYEAPADSELQAALLASLGVETPSSAPTAPAQEWACATCTFLNQPGVLYCEMCNSSAPSAALVHVPQQVPLSEEEQLRLAMERSMLDQ